MFPFKTALVALAVAAVGAHAESHTVHFNNKYVKKFSALRRRVLIISLVRRCGRGTVRSTRHNYQILRNAKISIINSPHLSKAARFCRLVKISPVTALLLLLSRKFF